MQTFFALLSGLGVLIAQIFSGTVGRIITTTGPVASQPPGFPTGQMPIGLTAVKEYKDNARKQDNDSFNPETYKNPSISGVSFRVYWKDLEPGNDSFNWQITDAVFSQASANGKWVDLIIVPGFETPTWALQGVRTGTFSRKYGRGAGITGPLPLPWDETYLSRWFNFLQVVSARYGNNPSFCMISAAGPTSVSAEMSLPNSSDDIQKWIALGYTPTKYLQAWGEVYRRYAQIFPKQYFGLALYPGLPINDQGVVDQSQTTLTRQRVIDEGLVYPQQFTLQTSGLNASKNDTSGTGGYDIVLGYNGSIITGFQMSTSATRNPDKMGDAHDPIHALQLSVDKGLQPNAGGKRIRFLEIYEPDILNPGMQGVLQSARAILLDGSPAVSPLDSPTPTGSGEVVNPTPTLQPGQTLLFSPVPTPSNVNQGSTVVPPSPSPTPKPTTGNTTIIPTPSPKATSKATLY
jgi:hypothetical protein